jgi:hypothetical protein
MLHNVITKKEMLTIYKKILTSFKRVIKLKEICFFIYNLENFFSLIILLNFSIMEKDV